MAGGQLFVTGYLGAGGWLFFFRAEDGIRDGRVTGVQTCALPILGILPAVLRDWQGRHPEIEVSLLEFRSEERRVGKSVDLGGRRIIKKKKKKKKREKKKRIENNKQISEVSDVNTG